MKKHRVARGTGSLNYPEALLNPEDLLTFRYLNHFTAEWKRLRLTDDDLRELEICIMASPKASPVIQGTGGLRKLRFSPSRWHMGKRGALRIGYVFFEEFSFVGMIVAFAKNDKADLTPAERKTIKKLISEMHAEVSCGR